MAAPAPGGNDGDPPKKSKGTKLYYMPSKPVAQQSDKQKLWYSFVQSIYRADMEAFEGLLPQIENINKNMVASNGWPAIMHAVHKNRYEFVEKLIERGAELKVIDHKNGRSLLHNAIEHGYVEMAQLLLRYDLDINTVDNEGESPLWTAARKSYDDMVELLLENNPSNRQICNINLRKSSNGQTALFVAADRGYLKVVKLLLGYQAMRVNVDEPDSHGRTPLMRACIHSHEEIVKLLLQHGADINAVNEWKRYPLMIAFRLNKPKICKLLLNNDQGEGIQLWRPDRNGKYILDFKTHQSDKRIAKQIESVLHTVLESALQEFNKDLPETIVRVICYLTY